MKNRAKKIKKSIGPILKKRNRAKKTQEKNQAKKRIRFCVKKGEKIKKESVEFKKKKRNRAKKIG